MKQSTRGLSLLLVLAMLCSLLVLPAAAEDTTGITLQAADGTTQFISDEQIKSAESVEVTADDPWGYSSSTFTGKFYSVKSILDNAGVDVSDAHGLKTVAYDGFTNGFAAADIENLYIYDYSEVQKNGTVVGDAGNYGTAIKGTEAAGNKWAKGVVTVAVAADHVWFFKGGSCRHYCSICGESEPSLTLTAADGTETTLYDCQIKAAGSVEATADDPWGYNGKVFTGTFYSVKSILENAGVDVSEAHGLKTVASDGFTNGFTMDDIDNLYIYDQGAVLKDGTAVGETGTYGTAIKGTEAAGSKWAKSIVSVAVAADHVWFFKGGACKHYCSICGVDEAYETVAAAAATCTETGLTEGKVYASCGTNTQEVVPALGHDYTAVVTDPTCTEGGYTTYTCSRCKDTYTADETAALGHDYTAVVTDPTCTEGGYTTYTCTRCGDTYTADETAALGHSWNDGEITTPASYSSAGEKTYTCTACGEEKTEVIPALGSPYTDVQNSGDYFYAPVLWAADEGITNGTSATTFSPSAQCTRADIVTFLWRLAGKPTPSASTCKFTDVKANAYYYNAVLWAVEYGITNGTSATTFSPNAKCTREQIVTFLWRAAGEPKVKSAKCSFTDVNKDAYSYTAILWAVKKGITNGTSATTFSPSTKCTRGQAVTFLYRAKDLVYR